jgi:hypothetical protein
MNYRAVDKRCALRLDSLNFNLPPTFNEKAILEILRVLGFIVIDVNIVELGRSFIGVSKYRLRARMAEAPQVFDCSSFTKFLYAQKGIWLPRLSIQQRREGVAVETPSHGDLVFTTGYRNFYETDPRDNIGHVGIATGEGTVIHATNGDSGVIESSYEDFHAGEIRGVRRIIQPGTVTLEQNSAEHLIENSDDFRWLVLKNVY